MFSEKELLILKIQIQQEIAEIESKFNKIELVNMYNTPKIDFGYTESQYLRELKALDSKLQDLVENPPKISV